MAERKRATGFVLMDAAFAADAKFVRLARRAQSPHDYAAAVGVFWLILGDARRGKSPIIDWDDYEEYGTEVALLKEVKLFLDDGFDPVVFDRWAPAYRSVPERTAATEGYERVRTDTKSTNASGQVSSGPVSSTNGTERKTFMSFQPKAGSHMGQHSDCLVCAPLRESEGTP